MSVFRFAVFSTESDERQLLGAFESMDEAQQFAAAVHLETRISEIPPCISSVLTSALDLAEFISRLG